MTRKLRLLILAILPLTGKAQHAGVQKNISGVQAGLFGIDLYDEIRIGSRTTLRAEASLFPAIWGGDLYARTGFAFYPALTLQPKFYYNIARRSEKGKNTKNNAANYLGMQLRYIPDWFVISNEKGLRLSNQVNIIPTYGFRRNFAGNFNYEFRAGIGYGTSFGETTNTSAAVLDLSMKIGYDF